MSLEIYICEVCQKECKGKKGLSRHIFVCKKEKKIIKCDFCQSVLGSNRALNRHLPICQKKKSFEVVCSLENKIKNLTSEISERYLELNLLKSENSEKEANIKKIKDEKDSLSKHLLKTQEEKQKLQTKVEVLSAKVEVLEKSKPTVINNISNVSNNQKYLQSNTFNLTPIAKDDLREMIEGIKDINHINSEASLAQYLMDQGLKDRIVNTDKSRKTLSWIDGEQQKEIKDPKGQQISSTIVELGTDVFKEKAEFHSQELFTDDFLTDDCRKKEDFYTNLSRKSAKSIKALGVELSNHALSKGNFVKNEDLPKIKFAKMHNILTLAFKRSGIFAFKLDERGFGDWLVDNLKGEFSPNTLSTFIIRQENHNQKVTTKSLMQTILIVFQYIQAEENINDLEEYFHRQLLKYSKDIPENALDVYDNFRKLFKKLIYDQEGWKLVMESFSY